MTIKEAEKRSGVSSRNIRFYEQKGLLTPHRNSGNDYREYSPEDIRTLMLIRTLRMLDMPLEQIRSVLEGEVSLQTAAAQQYEKLQKQIEKLEIAARFCEELAREEDPNIERLLARMDEPENRKMLAKEWPQDYAQTVRTAVLALAGGLIPVIFGWALVYPLLIAMVMGEGAVLVLSLLLPAAWVYIGYSFRGKGSWWLNLVLAHMFPAVVCGLSQWQLQFPNEQRIEWITEIGLALRTSMAYFTTMTETVRSPWLVLWVLLACFCLGGLIAWAIPIFRYGWKAAYGKQRNAGFTFFKKRNDIPRKLVAIIAAVVLPVVIILCYALFGPLDYSVTTEALQSNLCGRDEIWVETGEMTVQIEGSEEFLERFSLESWERAYLGSASNEVVLQVHMNADLTEPYSIAFYADGKVRVYESWLTTTEGFYRIPDGVVEAIWDYAKFVGTVWEGE